MKEITLEITGRQQYEGVEEDQMEFVTDGKLYIRKDEINNISYKVKNLRIVHHNGKKLTTDITIVNGNFKEKQLGDSAMLKMVYDDITECIYRSYKQVFQNIIDRRERLLKEKYGEDIIFDYKTLD